MNASDYALSFQKSPIIFTGGIAQNVPGGLLPIVSITQAQDFNQGILSGSEGLNLEDYLFDFAPAPGGTLADFEIGSYPFANQTVAANAIISEPLRFSLLMQAPVRVPGGFDGKLAVFQSLQASIAQHAALGGTYTVATPAYLYTNCILLGLRDATDAKPDQPQSRWQWDFVQPLLTLQAAQQAQNSLMQKISNGTQVTPGPNGAISYSGQGPAVGNPASGVGPSVVSAAQPLPGASVSGPTPAVHGPI